MALHVRITVHVCLLRGVTLRLGRTSVVMLVVTLQAGRQAHRHGAGHHGVGAHQHQRPSETRDLFWLMLPRPRPPCAHDDVALQQQHTNARGPHCFRLTSGRPDGRSCDAGRHPQRGRARVGRNPGREDQGARPRPSDKGPNQLEHGECRKEDPRRQPIPPVHRRDGEMDHGRTQRSDRRAASSQPAIGLRRFFGGHIVDHHTTAESARAAGHSGRVPDQQRTNADVRSNASRWKTAASLPACAKTG